VLSGLIPAPQPEGLFNANHVCKSRWAPSQTCEEASCQFIPSLDDGEAEKPQTKDHNNGQNQEAS